MALGLVLVLDIKSPSETLVGLKLHVDQASLNLFVTPLPLPFEGQDDKYVLLPMHLYLGGLHSEHCREASNTGREQAPAVQKSPGRCQGVVWVRGFLRAESSLLSGC